MPVCTVSPGNWVNKAAGATRLTMSDFRLNLLLLESQGCVLISRFLRHQVNKYKETDGKQIHTEVAVSSCVDNP